MVLIKLLVFANAGWAIVCLFLAVACWNQASVFGLAYLMGEAVFVGGLADSLPNPIGNQAGDEGAQGHGVRRNASTQGDTLPVAASRLLLSADSELCGLNPATVRWADTNGGSLWQPGG
jgi:hypothetical protein